MFHDDDAITILQSAYSTERSPTYVTTLPAVHTYLLCEDIDTELHHKLSLFSFTDLLRLFISCNLPMNLFNLL